MLPIEGVLFHYGADFDPNRGGNQKIHCPFHDDSVASASVNLNKGLFNCYGCEIRGDAISLVMQREGLDFLEAKQVAEGMAGEAGSAVPREPEPTGSLLPRRPGARQNRRGWRSPWGRRES